MRRSENGTVVYDPDGAADASRYDGKQFGWYVQGIYQFVQRWRVGLRYDRLNANNSVANRSEEHTSELQSLMRISYAVFCLKKKKNKYRQHLYQYLTSSRHLHRT